jgi:hypothetical protein
LHVRRCKKNKDEERLVKLIFRSAVGYYKMGRGSENWVKISHQRMY